MTKLWTRIKKAWAALVSREPAPSKLGYHKITCAVYYINRGKCNCGEGDATGL